MADAVVLNATEIARLAGVTRRTVLTWRRRDDFPAPAGGDHAAALYNRAAVEAWLAAVGLLELAPGPRVWREVSHRAQGASLGEAVSEAAAVAARQGDGKAPPPGVPGNLAWLINRAVDDVGAAAVVNDLLDRYAAESGMRVTPARISECMISLARVGEGATVLDPASGTGELLATALARGAGRVLAQDASAAAAEPSRTRLFPGAGQSAEVAVADALGADAFAGVEADAVVCRPPILPTGPEPAVARAQYALTHLKPGGRAVFAMPPTAAGAPSGRQARAELLRGGVLKAVIALPVAAAPPYVPLHLWVLERPDGKTEPDQLALFLEAVPEVRTGVDYAASSAAGTMPTACWRAFTQSIEVAGDSPRHLGKRDVCSGGGTNATWCVTRVADLLDNTGLLDKSERLDESVDLTPARVRAHFSAWHREKDAESARRRGNVQPRNPARTFTHSRLGRFSISRDIDEAAKVLHRLGWLGDARDRGVDARDRGVIEPQLWLPADTWQTATIPELARLGLLRYRRAGTGTAELLRTGDVLVPATVTEGTEVTVVGADRDGDPAGPGVHVIRPNPAHLNPWFLAGFLLSPGTPRGVTGNRVDVRQLEAPLLPLADQERYARVFRNVRSLESITGHLKDGARSLASNLTAGLTSGDFGPGREPPPHEAVA